MLKLEYVKKKSYLCHHTFIQVKKKFLAGVSLIITLAFLAGTTGISFRFHSCHASHRVDVVVFPEYSEESGEYCEGNCSGCHPETPENLSFSAEQCCITKHLYLKYNYTGTTLNLSFSAYYVNLFHHVLNEHLSLYEPPVSNTKYFYSTAHSPPLMAGKMLIHYIHQLRIPTPGC